MERKWVWKVILTLLLIATATTASVSTFVSKPSGGKKADPLPEFVREWFPGIRRGLDLQGGLRLVYEVEVDAAIEDKRDRIAETMVKSLADDYEVKDVKFTRADEPHKFALVFASADERASSDVQDGLKEFRNSAVIEMDEGPQSHLKLVDEYVDRTVELAVRQAIETIGNRIDELGLANTSVVSRETDIIVELPGIDEVEVARIKRIISLTARLEFKMVDPTGSETFFSGITEKLDKDGPISMKRETVSNGEGQSAQCFYLEAKNKADGHNGKFILKKFLKTVDVPNDRAIGFEKIQKLDDAGNPTADVTWRTHYLHRTAGLTGDYVDHAMVLTDETGRPYVSLDLNQEGARIFEDLTGKNIKRQMAIQLDDVVNSTPVIEDKIPGGRVRITLGAYDSYQNLFNKAQDLVIVLRAGALPAPLKPLQETIIGPALGNDSVNMGSLALMIAAGTVILFMLIYYRGGGIAADFALIINALFIFGILSGMGAVLTLPGIAGIILTIGMAVDANVIIYERIREELRSGKAPRAAVEAGYQRAFWTIFDAQITTFIAGVVMFQYGSGPIKGFAVTLLVGIVTSMFSAIFISRLFFEWMTRRRAEHLSI